jgi:glycosyltransferase involved in cell wall biosynthesis
MGSIEVSVIIPTYNYGRYIEETLNSLLNQTFEAWECIVIDNGSTDNTSNIIKQYSARDSRIKYFFIRHSTTSEARNTGLNKAQGRYIQFLDSDDLLSPEKLKCHADFLSVNPEIDLVYSDSVYFDDIDKDRKHLRKTRNANSPNEQLYFSGKSWELLPLINSHNIWTICSPMFRKSILDFSGSFNPKLNWVEDWEFYFRIIAQNIQIKHIDNEQSTCLIRVHQRSLSHQNLSMYTQGILARKFIKNTIKQLAINGYSNANELLLTSTNQITFLYKLKFNFLISDKKFLKAFGDGIIISIRMNDYKYSIKLLVDFSLNRMKPLDI